MTKAVAFDHIQIAMPRGEERAARSFYGDLLGLQEITKPAELAGRGGVWFRCGSLQLHLGVEDDFRPATKAHPAFVVDDLPALLQALKAAGFSVQHDEKLAGFVRAFSHDPFGNRIELMQPRPLA